mmetsp:Transcript_55630/g.129506  ORF Transcript_55630/g.129506 Transcript_55630/m.129506 type:complete len:234 (-) Transcript_55630:223-924(-)
MALQGNHKGWSLHPSSFKVLVSQGHNPITLAALGEVVQTVRLGTAAAAEHLCTQWALAAEAVDGHPLTVCRVAPPINHGSCQEAPSPESCHHKPCLNHAAMPQRRRTEFDKRACGYCPLSAWTCQSFSRPRKQRQLLPDAIPPTVMKWLTVRLWSEEDHAQVRGARTATFLEVLQKVRLSVLSRRFWTALRQQMLLRAVAVPPCKRLRLTLRSVARLSSTAFSVCLRRVSRAK